MQQTHSNPTTNWPDLTVDQTAWEMAKLQGSTTDTISEIAARAQRNKQRLLATVDEMDQVIR
jgi:hypothetical protein